MKEKNRLFLNKEFNIISFKMSKTVETTTVAYQIKYLHSKANNPQQIRNKLKALLPKNRLPSVKVKTKIKLHKKFLNLIIKQIIIKVLKSSKYKSDKKHKKINNAIEEYIRVSFYIFKNNSKNPYSHFCLRLA